MFFFFFSFLKLAGKSRHLLTSFKSGVLGATRFVLKFIILKSNNCYK